MSMSICDGIDEIIDEQFKEVIANVGKKPPHYKRTKSCQLLTISSRPSHFNADKLINNMLLCVKRNWLMSQQLSNRRPSKENWRFKKMPKKSEKNKSPEKVLEKKIAEFTSNDWVNQVPTASGLINENKDKKRSIDLVYKHREYEYELIELKVESNTPLSAAMEVLQYAILYMFSRHHYTESEQKAKKLLNAKKIHLTVLAPHKYYDECNLEWLEQALNDSLRRFMETQPFKLEMDFHFKAFPQDFNAIGGYSDEDCRSALKRIKPVYGLQKDL